MQATPPENEAEQQSNVSLKYKTVSRDVCSLDWVCRWRIRVINRDRRVPDSGRAIPARTSAVMRWSGVWPPALLLIVSVFLLGSLTYAIANLDRGTENLPSMEVPPPVGGSSTFGPTGEQFQAICQVTIASIFLIAIAGVVCTKLMGEKLGILISVWELLGYALCIGIFVILIMFWPLITTAFESLFPQEGVAQPPTPGNAGVPPPMSTSSMVFVAVFVFAAVLVAMFLFARVSYVRPRFVGSAHARQQTRRRCEAASTLRRALIDLKAGRDFRTSVLACYQKMCSILAIRGVSHQEVLTPREIELQALSELALSQKSIGDLTSLFEEARYSDHEIRQSQRDRAIECLAAISSELGN